MSDQFQPGVQITEDGVEIFAGDVRTQLIEHHYIALDGNHGLAYAQLVMLQALVERQAAIAKGLTDLALAITSAKQGQSVEAAMDMAMSRVMGHLAKLGVKLPGMPAQG